METQQAGRFSDIDTGSVLKLIGIVVGINALGALPAILGGSDSSWFASLEKPALYPPAWAFGLQMGFNMAWTPVFFTLQHAVTVEQTDSNHYQSPGEPVRSPVSRSEVDTNIIINTVVVYGRDTK